MVCGAWRFPPLGRVSLGSWEVYVHVAGSSPCCRNRRRREQLPDGWLAVAWSLCSVFFKKQSAALTSVGSVAFIEQLEL